MRKQLNIALTANCDCQCRHCYMDSARGNSPDQALPFWLDILKVFAEKGGKEVCFHEVIQLQQYSVTNQEG